MTLDSAEILPILRLMLTGQTGDASQAITALEEKAAGVADDVNEELDEEESTDSGD